MNSDPGSGPRTARGVVLQFPLPDAHGGDPAVGWRSVHLVADRPLRGFERSCRRPRAGAISSAAEPAPSPLPARMENRLSRGKAVRAARPAQEAQGSRFRRRTREKPGAGMGGRMSTKSQSTGVSSRKSSFFITPAAPRFSPICCKTFLMIGCLGGAASWRAWMGSAPRIPARLVNGGRLS